MVFGDVPPVTVCEHVPRERREPLGNVKVEVETETERIGKDCGERTVRDALADRVTGIALSSQILLTRI